MPIGIVSFTDPRETAFAGERENYIREHHLLLRDFLLQNSLPVIDPMEKIRSPQDEIFGIRRISEVEQVANILKREGAQCLVLCLWHWTEPQLPLHLVREMKLPTLLFTEDDPTWAGSVCITAVGASLWEAGISLNHHRVLGNKEEVVKWARAMLSLQRLRRSSLLLWGGSYCLRMEHLQDDIPLLKTFLVGDILSEDQYILIRKAEEIERKDPQRIEGFLEWLSKHNARIEYDEVMLTPEILRKQIALYLAGKDRLEELKDENIVGVSIKCQPELSEIYGVTACSLPAFIPFGEDSEGEKSPLATVCEGDIKGLITCALLEGLQPGVPSLFGDLKYVSNDYIIISNCGASSLFYASHSNKAEEALPRLTIRGQCQGKAGGAYGYDGKEGEITVARLFRMGGDYYLQAGLGRSLPITPEIKQNILWGHMWPHIAIDLGVKKDSLIEQAGANHFCAIVGNFLKELQFIAREADITFLPFSSG